MNGAAGIIHVILKEAYISRMQAQKSQHKSYKYMVEAAVLSFIGTT